MAEFERLTIRGENYCENTCWDDDIDAFRGGCDNEMACIEKKMYDRLAEFEDAEAEQDKGCKYCRDATYTDSPFKVKLQNGNEFELVFNFCPNCGRKLKGE